MSDHSGPLLALAGIVLVLWALYSSGFLSIAGLSPLSLTQVNISSTDQDLNGPAWLFTIAGTGSSESGEITLTPEAVAQYGLGSPDVGLTMSYDQTCKYLLKNQTQPVVKMAELNQQVFSGRTCGFNPNDYQPSRRPNWINYSFYKISEYIDQYGYHSTCTVQYRENDGAVHEIEPLSFFNLEIQLRLGNSTYIANLSQNEQVAVIPGVAKIKLLGSLQGSQSCPTLSSEAVAYLPMNSSAMVLRDKDLYGDVVSKSRTMAYGGEFHSGLYSYQSALDNFKLTTPDITQYCVFSNFSLQTASIECRPLSPVAIPVLQLYVKADKIGLNVPVGRPVIENVTAFQVEAGTRSTVRVMARNDGETASFDASVKCAKDLNPFSTRAQIQDGETKEVEISYEGVGIMNNCQVVLRDVNNPAIQDTETERLSILPICTISQPTPAHVRVMTEYGCRWICPNQYDDDIDPMTCAKLADVDDRESYDRCADREENGSCSDDAYISFASFHCTASGKYMKTNSYMDHVFKGRIEPFVSANKSHQVFLQAPACAYVAEYGYKIENGAAVALEEDYEFDYSAAPRNGLEIELQEPQGQVPVEDPTPPEQVNAQGIELWQIGGAIAVLAAAAAGYLYIKR